MSNPCFVFGLGRVVRLGGFCHTQTGNNNCILMDNGLFLCAPFVQSACKVG